MDDLCWKDKWEWELWIQEEKGSVFLTGMKHVLRAWAADILFRGSLTKSRLTKSFASEDREGHGGSSKIGSAFMTALNMPDSVRAQNERLPHKRIYAITPILQTSASVLYDLWSTSGAT